MNGAPGMEKFPLNDSERRLLEIVWKQGPVSRTELSKQTGLTEASISRLIKELLQRHWLQESVNRSGVKGQPRRPLTVNPEAAHACGVYFSHNRFEMGLTNLSGDLIHKSVRFLKKPSVAELVESTESCLEEILETGPIGQEKILGIGYSLPGDFIGEGSKINAHAYFPELMHVDLREELQSRMPFEIFVENDAACAALGERVHGIGQRFKNFILIHIGHGIGSGIIIDGKLFRGSQGNSGIIGVQFPNTKPRPSGQNLLEVLSANGIEVTDFDALDDIGASKTAPLKTWIKRASQQMIECLNLTARVLDPEAIIMGGRLPLWIIREMVMEIEAVGFCLEGVMLPRPKIYASSLGPEAGVIGTACLAFYQRLFSETPNQ